MLKIKEWKYDEMMKKVTRFGDKWMEFNDFARTQDIARTVEVVDGYVTYEGRFEVVAETEKAVKIDFNMAWTEWIPKSCVQM